MNAPLPKTDPKTDPKAAAVVGKFNYPPHPIAAIFPLLDPASDEFKTLMEDIKENDLREQICSL